MEAFVTTCNFNISCLSKTFLDSMVPQNNQNNQLLITMGGANHSSNSNRVGVCLYKEHSLLIKRNDLNILHECLVAKIIVDNKKCFSTCLYRSLNQNHEELENFCSNLNLLFSNINDNPPIL